jgi:hypothetical protein
VSSDLYGTAYEATYLSGSLNLLGGLSHVLAVAGGHRTLWPAVSHPCGRHGFRAATVAWRSREDLDESWLPVAAADRLARGVRDPGRPARRQAPRGGEGLAAGG